MVHLKIGTTLLDFKVDATAEQIEAINQEKPWSLQINDRTELSYDGKEYRWKINNHINTELVATKEQMKFFLDELCDEIDNWSVVVDVLFRLTNNVNTDDLLNELKRVGIRVYEHREGGEPGNFFESNDYVIVWIPKCDIHKLSKANLQKLSCYLHSTVRGEHYIGPPKKKARKE